jgi:hypothetical protein
MLKFQKDCVYRYQDMNYRVIDFKTTTYKSGKTVDYVVFVNESITGCEKKIKHKLCQTTDYEFCYMDTNRKKETILSCLDYQESSSRSLLTAIDNPHLVKERECYILNQDKLVNFVVKNNLMYLHLDGIQNPIVMDKSRAPFFDLKFDVL